MNTINYSFTLDLNATQSQINIPVTLGDTARTWLISFRDGSNTYKISDGCLAKLEILRPTGTHIEEFCAIEHNTTVRYSFSQNKNTAAVEGFHECAVVLYDEEGHIIGSPRFSMIVSGRVINRDNIADEDKLIMEAMVTAEAARRTGETERINAESARVAAEAQRTQNEVARQTADTERSLAEENRTKRFETLQKEINTAAATLVSPTVTVTPTENGHQVTITDHKYEHMFSVVNGKDGWQGPQGIQGLQGLPGKNGVDGYTPIKGIDYFTQFDKDELTLLIIEALGGQPIFGYVDDNNNIIVHGDITDGAYTVKYEMENGSKIDIGVLVFGSEIFINLLDTAYDTDLTTVFNGVGYRSNYRWSNSQQNYVTGQKCTCTGLIPLGDSGDVFHIRGVEHVGYKDGSNGGTCAFYDESGAYISGSQKYLSGSDNNNLPLAHFSDLDENGDFTIQMIHANIPTNTAYLRFTFGPITGDFIMSRNQLIPK